MNQTVPNGINFLGKQKVVIISQKKTMIFFFNLFLLKFTNFIRKAFFMTNIKFGLQKKNLKLLKKLPQSYLQK